MDIPVHKLENALEVNIQMDLIARHHHHVSIPINQRIQLISILGTVESLFKTLFNLEVSRFNNIFKWLLSSHPPDQVTQWELLELVTLMLTEMVTPPFFKIFTIPD